MQLCCGWCVCDGLLVRVDIVLCDVDENDSISVTAADSSDIIDITEFIARILLLPPIVWYLMSWLLLLMYSVKNNDWMSNDDDA